MTTTTKLSFAEARALKREIHAAALDVKRNLGGEPKCVVLTRQQYAALHMIEGGIDLVFLDGRIRMVSDADLAAPLPDGHWQILDFIPANVANRVARDRVGDTLISTVDLGGHLETGDLVLCFPAGSPRYELLVHEGDDEPMTTQYVTREAALAAHAEAVEKARAKEHPEHPGPPPFNVEIKLT